MASTAGRVFLSYRREDSRHLAGRLADRITARFPRVEVFMDVDNIAPGDDFGEAISQAVSSCDVLVALIGRDWLTVSDNQGRNRLLNTDDWVRQEIGTALTRHVRVIPVLVDGAEMPTAGGLPPDLSGLARRNAVRIDHDTFSSDVRPLLDAIDQTLKTPTRSTTARSLYGTPALLRKQADGRTRPASPRGVPIYRSAIWIGLWSLTFLFAMIFALSLGTVLHGGQAGTTSMIDIAGILFGLLIGLLALIHIETVAERRMIAAINDKNDKDAQPASIPAGLSTSAYRNMHIALGLIVIGLGCLAWFG